LGIVTKNVRGGSIFIGNVNRCELPRQYEKTVEAGGNGGLVAQEMCKVWRVYVESGKLSIL
jgi:hypothetical protein